MENNVSPAVQPIETAAASVKTKPSRIFPLVISLLVILMSAAIGALGYQFVKFRQDIYHTQQKYMSSVAAEQKTMEAALKSQTLHFTQQLQTQENALTEINTAFSELTKHSPQEENRLRKIREIVALVRMANLALNIQHNIPDALVLLKQADARLSSLQDAGLDSFHAALLKNIAALQIIPVPDIDALTTQLSNLRDETASLSILVAPKPNTTILENTPRQSHKKWFQRAWDNVKASLQKLVIVRHQDENIPALMAPEQQLHLQENLELLLIQAQWALLNHQPAIYQKSLKQAKAWVEKYYVQNSASTQNFLKQLEGLRNQNIAPAVPDISQTLALAHEEGL